MNRNFEGFNSFNCLLFDLDGTLVDTNDLIIRSYYHVLEKYLDRQVPLEELMTYFGRPLREAMQYFSPDNWEELVKAYREFNLANHDQLARPFSGVREALEELHRRGCWLAVVTSKARPVTIMGLRLCGLEHLMDVLVCMEDTAVHKPAPDPVLKALERLQQKGWPGRKEEALMVGDSPWDVAAGKAAGIATATVAWSLFGRQQLDAEKPDLVLETMSDLLKICGDPWPAPTANN